MVNSIESQRTSIGQTSMTHTMKTTTKETMEKHSDSNEEKKNDEKLSITEVEEMMGSLNDFLKSADSRLKFVLHDKLETYYVTIIDNETDEVIREIPSEKLMNIRAAMKEFVGLLVDRKI